MRKSGFNKVFCIGFNKTGTNTLTRIFKQLGLKALHKGCGWNRIAYPHSRCFHTKWWGDGDREILDQYTAFSDGENHALEVLDSLYPNSKFILNNRNLRKWLLSRLKHRGRKFDRHLIEFSILKRKAYYSYIFNYFRERPGKLLVCDVVKDGENLLKKICRFLDMDVPGNFKIPVINARESRHYDIKKYRKMIDKVLLEMEKNHR